MEPMEDIKDALGSVEDLSHKSTVQSSESVNNESVKNTPKVTDDHEDAERAFCKSEDGNVEILEREKQNALTEINTLQFKLEAYRKIVNNCERKIIEVKGHKISRRDYLFGFIQKLFGYFLPAVYALYGTMMLNFLLSLANAASDLSVFFWLLAQNHPKTANIILGKRKVISYRNNCSLF